MSDTPNLILPYIAAGQAQKHVTLNESLRKLDAVVQLGVLSRTLLLPPASPVEGERYLVPTGASGGWAGQINKIAAFQDNGWIFYTPRPGWCVYVLNETVLLAWTGTLWSAIQPSVNPAPLVGVNTTADATNRLAVKSDAALLSHDDVTPGSGDIRIAINKASAAKTASLLFQTGYSGRAEIGTAGDDKLRVKVSANGTLWTEAMMMETSGATKFSAFVQVAASGVPLIIDSTNGNGLKIGLRDNGVTRGYFGAGASVPLVVGNPTGLALARFVDPGGAIANYIDIIGSVTGNAVRINANGTDTNLTLALSGKGIAPVSVAGALQLPGYAKTAVPSAATMGGGAMIYVSDATGGSVVVFSDGTDWRRVTDRSVLN